MRTVSRFLLRPGSQEVDEVFLSGLAECEAVEGEGVADLLVSLPVSAEREERDVPLDLRWARESPVGEEIGGTRGAACGGCSECCLPRITICCPKGVGTVGGADVSADGVSLVAVDPAFSLLEVDGVGRVVPVDDGVAPPVEVDAFLPDGCGREDEGPEWAVEGGAYLRQAGVVVALTECAVAEGEAAEERDAEVVGVVGIERAVGRGSKRDRGAGEGGGIDVPQDRLEDAGPLQWSGPIPRVGGGGGRPAIVSDKLVCFALGSREHLLEAEQRVGIRAGEAQRVACCGELWQRPEQSKGSHGGGASVGDSKVEPVAEDVAGLGGVLDAGAFGRVSFRR